MNKVTLHFFVFRIANVKFFLQVAVKNCIKAKQKVLPIKVVGTCEEPYWHLVNSTFLSEKFFPPNLAQSHLDSIER